MITKKIKPAKKHYKIPNPKNGFFLRVDGEMVIMDKYWRRLLKAGDVVEVKEEEKEKPMKKNKPKKETIIEEGEK